MDIPILPGMVLVEVTKLDIVLMRQYFFLPGIDRIWLSLRS